MNPVVRTALTHAGSVAAGGFAVAVWAAGNVDFASVLAQAKATYGEIVKLSALLLPLIPGAIGAYKATFKSKLADVEKDDRFHGAVVAPEVAVDLGPKVQASLPALTQELYHRGVADGA